MSRDLVKKRFASQQPNQVPLWRHTKTSGFCLSRFGQPVSLFLVEQKSRWERQVLLAVEGCIKKVINSGYCFLQGRKYALLVGIGPPPGPATASQTNDLCAPSSPVSFPVLFLSRVSCLPILHKANRPDTRKLSSTLPSPTLSRQVLTYWLSLSTSRALVSTLVQHPAKESQ